MTLDVFPAAPHMEVSGETRLGHDGWVSEFEAFQWSEEKRQRAPSNAGALPETGRSGRPALAGGPSTGGGGADPAKAMDNLRAEIKLLHWHKLANEAALKAALLKTKKIKAKGGGTSRPVPAMTTLSMPTEERAAWVQQVIEEEQSKPLQVSKDFMRKYEEQEREIDGRLDTEVAAHIRSLRNLRKQIEKRGEMKARRVKYRAAQKQLELEKQQLLLGKVHRSGNNTLGSTGPRDETGAGDGTEAKARAKGKEGQEGGRKTVGALDTVLGSLGKLVELEKRISSLEKSNVYDDFCAARQQGARSSNGNLFPTVGRRRKSNGVTGGATTRSRNSSGRPAVGSRNRRLSFSKQKTEATIDTPSQTYYSVRIRRKPAGSTAQENALPKRRDQSHKSMMGQRTGAGMSSSSRGDATLFLTQLPDLHRHPKTVDHQGRCEGFNSAIVEKKRIEAKRKLAGDRAEAERIARQDRIIREWMQRKRAAAAGNRQRKSPVVSRASDGTGAGGQRRRVVGGGASATSSGGARHMHLQEFRDLRAHYAKRTERLRRDISRGQKGSARGAFLAGTRTVTATRPKAMQTVTSKPLRPNRMSRNNPSAQQGREVSRASAGLMRRGQTRTTEGRGVRMRRTGNGPRMAVGGNGLRAARARQQDSASVRSYNTRRRGGSQAQLTIAPSTVVLPKSMRGREGRHW